MNQEATQPAGAMTQEAMQPADAMNQEAMQPANADSPDAPSAEALHRVCGRTIVFVLAPNEGANANLEAAALAARQCHAPGIFIMADLSCADEAVSAVRRLQRKGRTMMQAAEFDFSTAYGDSTCGSGFHLEELPLNMLQVMATLAQSVLDIYESILVIDATEPAPTVGDLYALCQQLVADPALGQASMGSQASPSPYALDRRYLDELEAVC